jgi:hypothetical protein
MLLRRHWFMAVLWMAMLVAEESIVVVLAIA